MSDNNLLELNLKLLGELSISLAELKNQISGDKNPLSDEWISRKNLMKFLDYGATQMAALEKSVNLGASKVGKRKFYLVSAVKKYLRDNMGPGISFD